MNVDTGTFTLHLDKMETRLSLDVAARALSRKMRRVMAVGVASAILSAGLIGFQTWQLDQDHAQLIRLNHQRTRLLKEEDHKIDRLVNRETQREEFWKHHDPQGSKAPGVAVRGVTSP